MVINGDDDDDDDGKHASPRQKIQKYGSVFLFLKRDMFSRFCHGFCLPFSEFYFYKGDVADFAMDFAGHDAMNRNQPLQLCPGDASC